MLIIISVTMSISAVIVYVLSALRGIAFSMQNISIVFLIVNTILYYAGIWHLETIEIKINDDADDENADMECKL